MGVDIPFVFISKMKYEQMAISRKSLVLICNKDILLLKIISEHARFISDFRYNSSIYMSFYVLLICEILLLDKKFDSNKINLVLVYLSNGMKRASIDFNATILLILGVATKTLIFTSIIIEDIFELISRIAYDVLGQQVLMVLNLLCATHPTFMELPYNALKNILDKQRLFQCFITIVNSGTCVKPLLHIFIRPLLSVSLLHIVYQFINYKLTFKSVFFAPYNISELLKDFGSLKTKLKNELFNSTNTKKENNFKCLTEIAEYIAYHSIREIMWLNQQVYYFSISDFIIGSKLFCLNQQNIVKKTEVLKKLSSSFCPHQKKKNL